MLEDVKKIGTFSFFYDYPFQNSDIKTEKFFTYYNNLKFNDSILY